MYQKRAILMVHALYLGAVIRLYRPFLFLGRETGQHGKWSFDFDKPKLLEYQLGCEMAAKQIASLLGILCLNPSRMLWCWGIR
jgi:hypothetical protein